jgi:hypothetical protein
MELVVDNESIVDRAWRKLEALGFQRPKDNDDDE